MDWIAALEHEGHALSVAARHDPQAAVPSCPDWTVDDLLRHIGRTHHWAGVIVRERRTEPMGQDGITAPHGGSLGWYEAGLAALLDALREIDPATPMWTFDPNNGTASFWARRMAHETAVHRVDAEQATGGVNPVAPDLAIDGVAEALRLFLPMLVASRGEPAGGTLHLHATDVEGEWLLTFGEGMATVEEGHAKGDAAVRGRAEDLYLWLWGRVPLDRLEVFGDAELAERLRRICTL